MFGLKWNRGDWVGGNIDFCEQVDHSRQAIFNKRLVDDIIEVTSTE
jgi:hypothetical protein